LKSHKIIKMHSGYKGLKVIANKDFTYHLYTVQLELDWSEHT